MLWNLFNPLDVRLFENVVLVGYSGSDGLLYDGLFECFEVLHLLLREQHQTIHRTYLNI